MRALVLATALLSASASHAAGALGTGAIGVGGGSFSGGTLTTPLVLDATNTLCSQALALSFNGDADTGIQRNAANTWLLCAGGVAALTLSSTAVTAAVPIMTTGAGSCSAVDIGQTASRGIAFEVGGSNRILFCNGGNPALTIGATTLTGQNGISFVTVGTGAYAQSTSAAGINAKIYSDANAAGEYGVVAGTTATLAGATLDTPVFAACSDCDGTPVYPFIVDGAGHLDVNGTTPSDCTTGTCTGSETCTGDDFHGTITASCTAQTAIVTFGRAWPATPICFVVDKSGLPTALSWAESTTALTITATGSANAVYTFQCWLP